MPKVLVADDSVSVRRVVERALDARRIEVLSVASGTEAIDRIERENPDLVVCDVIMPDRDGYQICDFVKKHPRLGNTPVLLISGIVNNSVLAQAAKVRSDDVLRKPFEADELVQRITALLSLSAAEERSPAHDGMSSAALAHARITTAPVPVEPARHETVRPSPPSIRSTPVAEPMAQGANGSPAPAASLRDVLGRFLSMSGVDVAALVDREGFVIESAGRLGVQAEAAAALASCLAESSDGIGRELGRGALQGMLFEYETGVVLLQSVGATAIIVLIVRDPAALGKVRYYLKKALPDLHRAL